MLAFQFGIPVRELKRRISADEFTEWCVFLSLDPPLGRRLDVLAKCVVDAIHTLGNCWGAGIAPDEEPLVKWGWDETDQERKVEHLLAGIAAK